MPFLRKLLVPALIFLLAAALWSFLYDRQFDHLTRDGLDYAQVGRQLATGRGLTTEQLYPIQIEPLAERGLLVEYPPNLMRFPFPSIVMAILFLFLGSGDLAAVFSSGLFFMLSFPALYFLGKRFFSTRDSLLVVFLFFLCVPVAYASIEGLADNAAVFFSILTFLLLFKMFETPPKARLDVVFGLVLGLAFLCRTNTLLFVPVYLALLYLWGPKGSFGKRFLLVMLGFTIPTGWYFHRNITYAGNPLFSFTNQRTLLWYLIDGVPDPAFLLHPPSFWTVLFNDPLRVASKFARLIVQFFTMGLGITAFIPLILIGLFRPASDALKKLLVITILFWALQVVLFSFGYQTYRYYFNLYPLLFIFAAIGLLRLSGFFGGLWKGREPPVAGLCAALVLTGLSVIYGRYYLPRYESPPALETLPELDRIVPEDKLIASDASAFITWYADRKTLRLPQRIADLKEIDREYLEVPYIYFSPRLRNDIYREWIEAGFEIEGYRVLRRFDNGSVLLVKSSPGT